MYSLVSSEGAAPPIIDLSGDRAEVARQVRAACSSWGAFVATGHGVPLQLLEEVLAAGHSFFNLPLEVKQRLCLTQQGTSWRGYMAQGGESSEHGARVDHKEGLYLTRTPGCWPASPPSGGTCSPTLSCRACGGWWPAGWGRCGGWGTG